MVQSTRSRTRVLPDGIWSARSTGLNLNSSARTSASSDPVQTLPSATVRSSGSQNAANGGTDIVSPPRITHDRAAQSEDRPVNYRLSMLTLEEHGTVAVTSVSGSRGAG